MGNNWNVSQASTLLNGIVQQATGQSTITNIANPGDFVSVAQTTLLQQGRDRVIDALSQVWSNTIFSGRAYQPSMASLRMSLERYGNAVRKISPVAAEMLNDQRYIWPVAYDSSHTQNPLGNGESVDMWKISKQRDLQTNFYGTAVYSQRFTVFKDQFDQAFTSMDEFMRFNALNMQERANDRASFEEAVARGLQANYIGALLDEGNNDRVIHLITEYNAKTGLSLTPQSVYKPENFSAFIRWVYSRIGQIIRLMGARSEKFQTVINNLPVLRHSKPENLRVALAADAMEQINSMVLSDTYNADKLSMPTWESVDYWQSIETPDSIAITPVYTGTNGSLKNGALTEQAGIFGVIHDKDALGYAFINNNSATTPINIDGYYWNTNHTSTVKTISDVTEKGVVLLLD